MARSSRFTIAGLMGMVLLASLALAALRTGSAKWASMVALLTCGVLILGVVGVACGGRAERAWWLGFGMFGWGYLVPAFWSDIAPPPLPTVAARRMQGLH